MLLQCSSLRSATVTSVVVALFLRTTRCIISTTAYFMYFIPSLSVARMAQTFHNLQYTSYDRFTQKLSSEPIFSQRDLSHWIDHLAL